jgi:hypothetical protein
VRSSAASEYLTIWLSIICGAALSMALHGLFSFPVLSVGLWTRA